MRWWWRIQLAAPILGIVNLSLVSTAAAPVLADYLGCRRVWLVAGLPIGAIAGLALVGYCLDHAGYLDRNEREGAARSYVWRKTWELLEELKREKEK
jgi:hypothetical protein